MARIPPSTDFEVPESLSPSDVAISHSLEDLVVVRLTESIAPKSNALTLFYLMQK